MYKNQLQELAQRSCFNLPSYTSIREGPDHAPRFKSTVNFNGETFESPNYCTTLRLAEHSAAEVALNALASRGPSNSLAARVLDETGVYKNLLQEVSQRVGASLPTYTTFRSGLGHLPVFTGVVELAGFIFTGEPAKNKKQAEKNAAMAAWSSLKSLTQQSESSSSSQKINDEQEHVTVARALQKFRVKAVMSNIPFPIKFPTPEPKTTGTQTPPPAASSKILPLICPRTTRTRPGAAAATTTTTTIRAGPQPRPVTVTTTTMNNNILPFYLKTATERQSITTTTGGDSLPQKFPVAGAPPYIPVRHYRATAHHGIAPPVTIRNAIPVYSAPPIPPPHIMRPPPPVGVAPPVCVRQAVPVFAAPPVQVKEAPQPVQVQEPPVSKAQIVPLVNSTVQIEPNESAVQGSPVPVEEPPVSPSPLAANPLPEREIAVVEELKELKM